MWLPFNTSIWFYRQPINFRKQIDGIVMLIADTLQKNPTSGQLFVFRNKGADKIKLLYWEDNGFWLLYKRFEQGKFQFPAIDDQSMSLSRQQLQLLLSGLKWSNIKPHITAEYRHFF
ncbi:MAG: IS66 family insertion sequence element accessory protein TnpB [Arenicella sp.]